MMRVLKFKYIWHNLFTILIVMDLAIGWLVYWNISRTCFIIYPGEAVLRFPLIEENYNWIIIGLCINICIVIYQMLKIRKKDIIHKGECTIIITYNLICYLLILLGYGHIATTEHKNIITEYNPLFYIFIEIIKCDFLKEYHWVMSIYTILSLLLILLNSILLYIVLHSLFKSKELK